MNLAGDRQIPWPEGVALLGCWMRWTKTREVQYHLAWNELYIPGRGTLIWAYLDSRSSFSVVVVFRQPSDDLPRHQRGVV
jgi:hypothetical protein